MIAALGVSHVYLSPILQAVPGSSHGYDVLVVRGVRKTFEAELAPVRALRGVDLDVFHGETLVLLGGGVLLALFVRWEGLRIGRGEGALLDPTLLRNAMAALERHRQSAIAIPQ